MQSMKEISMFRHPFFYTPCVGAVDVSCIRLVTAAAASNPHNIATPDKVWPFGQDFVSESIQH